MKRILVLCAAFIIAAAAPGPAQTPATLNVTTTYIDSGAELFYAQDMGFFQKAGLNVNIIPGKNGSAMAASVAGGAADIGYSDIGALSKAYTKGIKFVLVAPAALWSDDAPVNQVIVAKNSPIRGAKDLTGKVFAVPGLGTGAEYSARVWIDKNGGDSNNVKFIELPYSAMPEGLASGRIDAAYVAEPFLAEAKKVGRLLAFADDAVGKEFLRTAWFATADWAKAHPDLARRFAAVMKQTALWANDKRNQAKSAEILVKYTKIDPGLVSSMIRAKYGVTLTAATVQPEIDVTAKYQNFTTFPAADLIASN